MRRLDVLVVVVVVVVVIRRRCVIRTQRHVDRVVALDVARDASSSR